NDLAGAIARVEKALACGARGDDEGALRLVESEARRWRGENELARTAAVLAMRWLRRGGPGWCDAASELAAALGALGATDDLVALARELESAAPFGSHSQLVDALARVARPLFWAGKHALAKRVLARADALARSAAVQPTALAALDMARGVEARVDGDPGACVRWNELAVEQSALAGDLRGGCVERGNLGYAYNEIGAYADAERALGEALATADRLGLPLVAATARQNLGVALARRGAFSEALDLERVSFATFEAQGDFRRAGCSLLYRAIVEAESGALLEAAASARRAAEMVASIAPLRCHALAVLAQIELARGEAIEGARTAGEAYALFNVLGNVDEGESRVRLVRAEAALARGDDAGARAAMAEAVARLLARAGKIGDAARREAFLGAIPENARTVELARAWGVAAAPATAFGG
ncbi:MAG TPA: serine/threonine-protein kinase PknK, partial [Minicystis sp.]|nr:serine/threonine-protein kinase PknK [Minicystis sp.]